MKFQVRIWTNNYQLLLQNTKKEEEEEEENSSSSSINKNKTKQNNRARVLESNKYAFILGTLHKVYLISFKR
jgi:hypothetical protein